MANVLFTRTSDPNSKPVTDGQLIFDTSGNGKMYLDNGTDRLEMGGALTVDATLSKTSTNPVQNKAVAGVMLDTLSDIGNVTSKGFLTDALAVKELNTNVNELNNSFVSNIYVGNDGKLHKIQGGADSVLPFKNSINIEIINKDITVTKNLIPLYMANSMRGTGGALARSSLNGVSPIPNNKVKIISGSDIDGYGTMVCELLVKEGDILSVSSYRDCDNIIVY